MMTETASPYLTHSTGSRPAVIVPEPEPPLSPRMRLFVIAVRAALLMLVDALGELADLKKRA